MAVLRAQYDVVAAEQRLWISVAADKPTDALNFNQATQQLGQEACLIIFDASQRFSADAFGAVIGSLIAGGRILVLLPTDLPSRWLKRFVSIAQKYACVKQCTAAQQLTDWLPPQHKKTTEPKATAEQQAAIAAVLKVVHGHRRRPLVISSDRGRGKSALLGMAAAQLLQQGKQRIVVTAPGFANSKTLMKHAQMTLSGAELKGLTLHWQTAQIAFIAPDELLSSLPATDLLIIDEAAAIPAFMLEKLLQHYSRVVFATTEHGYEGTGRGFALRFQKILDNLTPDWHKIQLKKAIRWADNDQLEQFSYEALLLDAEATTLSTATLNPAVLHYQQLDKKQLLADETLLRQTFGLMVSAHYRTRPSDLQNLLDHEEMSVSVLRHQGQVLAACWTIAEPAMDETLAEQVFNGQRRPKGQLLPQSLLLHGGLAAAGDYHYCRISRIAVHPDYQRQGLGQQLLQQLAEQQKTADILGVSFAFETAVFQFWLQAGYQLVRIGQQRDEVTGSMAVMLLKPQSEQAATFIDQAQQRLSEQWPWLLQRQQQQLSAAWVVQLSAQIPSAETTLPDEVMADVRRFVEAQCPYESVEYALQRWLATQLATLAFQQLTLQQQMILIAMIMQGQPVAAVAEQAGVSGKKALIGLLRQAGCQLLAADCSDETR